MDINHSAPVAAQADITIDAPQENVWETLVNVDRWPDWNPDVKSVTLEGGIHEGGVFRWKTGSGTIRSTFETVDPPHHVAWTGTSLGIKAIHVWSLEPVAGTTTIRTAESFEGFPARLMRRRLQNTLQTTLEKTLQTLKAEVERTK
jgi:uncharacterized protein YndB with AHSA1/START domain